MAEKPVSENPPLVEGEGVDAGSASSSENNDSENKDQVEGAKSPRAGGKPSEGPDPERTLTGDQTQAEDAQVGLPVDSPEQPSS